MTPIKGNAFWIDDEPPRTSWVLKAALLLGLIVWVFAFIGVKSVFGQVTAEAHLSADKLAEVSVGPVATAQRVSILIYRNDSTKVLGDTVAALISPRDFVLQPGVVQIVRVRIDESVQPGEVLRVATLFMPQDSASKESMVRVAIRLVTKMVAP